MKEISKVGSCNCRFPMWPHHAGTEHPKFGMVCAKPTVPSSSWCPEHEDVVWDVTRNRRIRGGGQPAVAFKDGW